MKILFRILILAILSINLASCAKETKEEQKKLILLTNPNGWLRVKMEISPGGSNWTDITSSLTNFEKDNLIFFDPSYDWWDDEGELKFPGDPKIIAHGTYSLIDNRSKILKDNGEILDILEISKTSLILQTIKNNIIHKTTYQVKAN